MPQEQKEVHLDRTHPSYASSEQQYTPLYHRFGRKDEQKGHDNHQQDERAHNLENDYDHDPYAHGYSVDHHDQHNWQKIQDLTKVQPGVVIDELQMPLDVQTHHQT